VDDGVYRTDLAKSSWLFEYNAATRDGTSNIAAVVHTNSTDCVLQHIATSTIGRHLQINIQTDVYSTVV